MAPLARLRKRARRTGARAYGGFLTRFPPGSGHPRVYQTPWAPKERHHFDRYGREPFTARSLARYPRLFPRPAGRVSGEWTPRYMHDPWTPPLLARAAPDARLLVLLRDPVERFRSGDATRLFDAFPELDPTLWRTLAL